MHCHKGNAKPAEVDLVISSPKLDERAYIIRCRKTHKYIQKISKKVTLWNSSLCHASARGRDRKVLHGRTTTFLL